MISTTTLTNSEQTTTNLQFPWKLFQMLERAEEASSDDREIVSWLPCGRAFQVHNKSKFCEKLMPTYFASKIYKSFHRSLNLWGFETVRMGRHKGAIYHPYFVRDHPDLCHRMKRTKLKNRVPMKTTTTKGTRTPQDEIPSGTVICYPESPPRTISPVTSSSGASISGVQEEQEPSWISSMSDPLLPPTLNPALLEHLLLRQSNDWDTHHASTATNFQQHYPTPSPQPSILEQQLLLHQQQQSSIMTLVQHNPNQGMVAGGGGGRGMTDSMLVAAALQVLSGALLSRLN